MDIKELFKKHKLYVIPPIAIIVSMAAVYYNMIGDNKEKENYLKQQAEIIKNTREDFTKDSLFFFIDQLNPEDLKLFVEYTLPKSFDFKEIEDVKRYLKIREYIVSKGMFTWTDIDDAIEEQLKLNLYYLSFETVEDIAQYINIRNYIVAHISVTNNDIDDYMFYKIIEQLAHNDLSTPKGLKTYIIARDFIAKNLNLDKEEIDKAVKYKKSPKTSRI